MVGELLDPFRNAKTRSLDVMPLRSSAFRKALCCVDTVVPARLSSPLLRIFPSGGPPLESVSQHRGETNIHLDITIR